MNTEQPLALKLALHLRGIFISEEITAYKAKQIASELERLHTENEKLRQQRAGGGEPVATVQRLAGRTPSIAYSQKRIEPLAHGTKLYTAPPETGALLDQALEHLTSATSFMSKKARDKNDALIAAIRKHRGERK